VSRFSTFSDFTTVCSATPATSKRLGCYYGIPSRDRRSD